MGYLSVVMIHLMIVVASVTDFHIIRIQWSLLRNYSLDQGLYPALFKLRSIARTSKFDDASHVENRRTVGCTQF